MSSRRAVPGKSPLHPSALRVGDLTIGRRIIRFHRAYGIVGEYTVVAKPHLGYLFTGKPQYEGEAKALVVTLRNERGETASFDLGDLGTIPYYGRDGWSTFNFVVDARKCHLLPRPDSWTWLDSSPLEEPEEEEEEDGEW